jgi:hypothetical protein
MNQTAIIQSIENDYKQFRSHIEYLSVNCANLIQQIENNENLDSSIECLKKCLASSPTTSDVIAINSDQYGTMYVKCDGDGKDDSVYQYNHLTGMLRLVGRLRDYVESSNTTPETHLFGNYFTR